MKKEQFYELLGEIDDTYINEADIVQKMQQADAADSKSQSTQPTQENNTSNAEPQFIRKTQENSIFIAKSHTICRKKRTWKNYALPVAACLGIVAIAGLLYRFAPNLRRKNPLENSTAMQIGNAVYPELPEYPDEKKFSDRQEFNAAYQKWKTAQLSFQTLSEDDKDGFSAFFVNSTPIFLADTQSGNKVFSPLSLYMALGLSAEITSGNSRNQILDVLAKKDIESLRSCMKTIWKANYMDDGMAKCVLANSLWLNNSIPYAKDTIDSVAQNYYASVYSGTPGSAKYDKLLQDWLNAQTDGLLSDYVSAIKMDPDTLLVLASTVNYNGKWQGKFNKDYTKTDTFHTPSGDVSCDFMNAQRVLTASFGQNFTAIALPFENNGEMRLILPDEGITPEELLSDEETLLYMQNTRTYENSKSGVIVTLSLPKFDASSQINLTDGLRQLGITDIFDAKKSDFTPLFVSEKINNPKKPNIQVAFTKAEQDTRVLIDEEGCKASSFTIMAMAGGSMETSNYLDFILDRPFLFEIVSESGLPLFVGIINNPAQH